MMMLWWLAMAVAILMSRDANGQDEKVERLEEALGKLYKQVMRNQFYQEEMTRSTGSSGIKQVRVDKTGDRPYHAYDHGGRGFMAMHEHANSINIVGLGEFIAVLNGVEFRTRHNDYRVVMASRTSREDRATEPIPLPPVPPEVLQKETVAEQIAEMREWFKAFLNNDRSPRDYRPYFKPNICYLEGAWTHTGEIAEDPFFSDRHNIGHLTWDYLNEKVEYASYSGSKDKKENFAYLPTKIWEMNGTDPVVVQWNYRILCEPVEDVPLVRLRPVDDLASRMRFQRATWEEHVNSRSCRFEYNWWSNKYPSDHFCNHCEEDKLMEQVPGRDNYGANLSDLSFDQLALQFETLEPLNVAYYNRRYKAEEKGAMGSKNRRRGFSDPNVFMAQTTQPKIAAMTNTVCDNQGSNCHNYTSGWTYAIPLEIIFTTPLLSWNPHNIIYKGHIKNDEYRSVTKDGRNGGLNLERAYNGTNSVTYYMTPAEFFESDTDNGNADKADTAKNSVGVLDAQGDLHKMVASGHRIMLDAIPGVGIVRTRYPIAPIHNEGNQILKEVEALKDIVTKINEYHHMLHEIPNFVQD